MMNARRMHRTIKPEGAPEINWAHPFAADLLVAVCPGEGAGPLRDLVSGNRSSTGANGSWTVMKSGRAVRFTNTQYNVIATRPQAGLANAYTVLWGGSFKSSWDGWDNWGGLYCLPSNGGAKSFISVQRDSNGNNMQLFHNDMGGVLLNTTIDAYANSDLVMAASWDGVNLKEFRNGTLVKTAVASYAPTGTPDNKVTINSERALGGEAAQTLSFFYVFAKKLPDDVIANLSQNPFQILKARRSFLLGRQTGVVPTDSEALPADGVQAQLSEAVLVTQNNSVIPVDGLQAQGAAVVALSQGHAVAAGDAAHVQTVGAGAVTVGALVAVEGALSLQAVEAVLLGQQHWCLPAVLRQAQNADGSFLLLEGVRPPLRRTEAISGEMRRMTVGRKYPVLKPRKH